MTTWALERHPPIPGYEPVRVLGYNGAIVYLARSLRLDKPAVLQVWSGRPFPSNAATMVGLDHPNIVGVFDVGEVDGQSYVAFEYVEAETLGQRLQKGPLTDIEARKCGIAIAFAVEFVRKAGAVVANLTPESVLLADPLKLFIDPFASVDIYLDYAPPEATSWRSPIRPTLPMCIASAHSCTRS